VSDAVVARQAREEALARLLAAQDMGLIKDPLGVNLPQDLWAQRLAQAKDMLLRARTK
jgi:hypothetical protein